MLSPEATRTIVARLEGEDPAKVLSLLDRVVENIYRRVDQLKALGNAQVPSQAAAAWRFLIEQLENEQC